MGKTHYMAKGNSLRNLLGKLSDLREVKTFDNQRNAKQTCNVDKDVAIAMSYS
jgi:hypothetical protein